MIVDKEKAANELAVLLRLAGLSEGKSGIILKRPYFSGFRARC